MEQPVGRNKRSALRHAANALFIVSPRRGGRNIPDDWAGEFEAVGEFGGGIQLNQ
jgi:hypothetical protein